MSARAEEGNPVAGADEEFETSRTFDAPRELVWKAWTEVERLEQWMSPKGMKTIAADLDFRVGGTYHYGLQMPNGGEMWGIWTFREIDPPRRLVYVNSFSDRDRKVTRHPMSADWPREMLSTITFEDEEGKTRVTVRWKPLNANEVEQRTFDAARSGMQGGWRGTFEQLEAYLASERG